MEEKMRIAVFPKPKSVSEALQGFCHRQKRIPVMIRIGKANANVLLPSIFLGMGSYLPVCLC